MTALDRVVRQAGGTDVVDRLVALSGSDLTTLLLHVMRERAARLAPTDVLRRFREDRFTAPASTPFDRLRAAEDRLLSLLPTTFRLCTLAPVVPLGTHSAVGTVDQNKVLATSRSTEVAADATNGLALVAAEERRAGSGDIRLAALQRVVRAQLVDAAGRFAHFGLFAMVSAGRDTGDLAFERHHVVEHVRYLAAAIGGDVELRLSVAEPALAPVADALRAGVADLPVRIVDEPDRVAARVYYRGFCYKVFAVRGTRTIEIGDGGLVDWTVRLLNNRKERMVISGVGVDGLASL